MNRITAIALTLSLLIGGSIVAPPTTPPAHSATQNYWKLVSARDRAVQDCWKELARLKAKQSPSYQRRYQETMYLFRILGGYDLEHQLYLVVNQAGILRATR